MGLAELTWPGLHSALNLASSTGDIVLSHGFLEQDEVCEVEATLPHDSMLVCVHLSGRIWVDNSSSISRYNGWGHPASANFGIGGVKYAIRYRADDCQFVRFLISQSLFRQALDERHEPAHLEFIDPQNRKASGLASIARRAVALGKGLPSDRLLADSIGYSIAAEILNTWSNQPFNYSRPPVVRDAQRERMKRVADYAEAHLYGQITLSELSSVSGLSLPHFMRVFRAEFGMPPYRWIMGRKIERAKEIMRTKPMSLTDIAHLLEFSSLQHFSAAFRKHCGMSPSQFRTLVRPTADDQIL
jgi:AraC-like DNA-binding protein